VCCNARGLGALVSCHPVAANFHRSFRKKRGQNNAGNTGKGSASGTISRILTGVPGGEANGNVGRSSAAARARSTVNNGGVTMGLNAKRFLAIFLGCMVAPLLYFAPPSLEVGRQRVVCDKTHGDDSYTYITTSRPVGRDKPLLKEVKEEWDGIGKPEDYFATEIDKQGVTWYKLRRPGGPQVAYVRDTTRLLVELSLVLGGVAMLCALFRPDPTGNTPPPGPPST
jgi:hypothetical protein